MGRKVAGLAGVMVLLLAACVSANASPTPVATSVTPPTTQPASASGAIEPTAATAIPVTIIATPAPIQVVLQPSATPDTPTATPAPTFVQLTQGGCCVQPFFSPDGTHVLFIDKPAADAPTGVWAVNVAAPLSEPQLFSELLGPFSRDLAYAADLVNGRTVVRRLGDGAQFPLDNGGRSISFAPDNSRIAWTVQEEAGGFDVRRTDVWVANIDGGEARRVVTRYGGGSLGWLPDSQRILLGGKAKRADAQATLSLFDLRDGSTRDLIQVERLRSGALSPDGRWLLYFVGQASDATQDGTFLLDLEAVGAQPQRLDLFGAYRWRDANRLLYVPLMLDAPGSELWQLDVRALEQTRLFAADAASPFKIANGDWDVSRDGARLIFLSARDRNVWLATLP